MKETLDKQITIMQSLTTKIINLNPIVNNNSLTTEDIEQLNNKIITLENKFKSIAILDVSSLESAYGARVTINNINYNAYPSEYGLFLEDRTHITSLQVQYPITISVPRYGVAYIKITDLDGNILLEQIENSNSTLTCILNNGPKYIILYYSHGKASGQ